MLYCGAIDKQDNHTILGLIWMRAWRAFGLMSIVRRLDKKSSLYLHDRHNAVSGSKDGLGENDFMPHFPYTPVPC